MKRLALLWLACAAAGFVLAACVAGLLALAVDHRAIWHGGAVVAASAPAQHAASHNTATPETPVDTGRRLLGE